MNAPSCWRATVSVLLVVCAAIGVGVGVEGSLPRPVAPITSVVLPTRFSFNQIRLTGSGIELTGLDVATSDPDPAANAACVSALVNRQSLELHHELVGSCNEIDRSSPSIWADENVTYNGYSSVRIARLDPRTHRVVVGPVVMRWEEASDTGLEQVVGDGSLWLVDVLTPKGAEVVRVSESTGRVANVIPLPKGTDRPILATDDDGLWIGTAVNGGYASNLSGSPLYHIAVGSNRATLVRQYGRATFWMLASGSSVWVDFATDQVTSGPSGQMLWRFDGDDARPAFHVNSSIPFGVSVIGNAREGLWTIASRETPGSPPNADTDKDCTSSPALVYINPANGKQYVETALPAGTMAYSYLCEGEDLEQHQGVIDNGYLYLLDDGVSSYGVGFTRLFRIRLEQHGSSAA